MRANKNNKPSKSEDNEWVLAALVVMVIASILFNI